MENNSVVNQDERPFKNGFAAAQNLFRLKYDYAEICLKSINEFDLWKVEKSLIRRLAHHFSSVIQNSS
jgi:hypothetical protein